MAVLRSSAPLFAVGRQEVYFHIHVDKLLFSTKEFSLLNLLPFKSLYSNLACLMQRSISLVMVIQIGLGY